MTVEFAQRLQAHMKLKGYSQRELGGEVGVSHTTISKLISVNLNTASHDVASKLSRIIPDPQKAEFILLAHGHSVAEVEQILGHHVQTPQEIISTRRTGRVGIATYDLPIGTRG